MNYGELLRLAAPETIVAVAAFLVLGVDLWLARSQPLRQRMPIAVALGVLGCVASFLWMFYVPAHEKILNGMLVVDPLTLLVKQVLLVLSVFTLIISYETNFTDHAGEYVSIILLATVGMMFLVSSEEILMIFVALELTSLSLYILTAFNKRNIHSAEAALKYFFIGSMSAAFTLYGFSLIYGLSGATNLAQIAAKLKGQPADPLLCAAIVMTVIGFGFKVAAVPFHLWAPDAYQGAPTPSAAFIASGSKVASFFIFAKVMMVGFAGAEGSGAWQGYVSGWMPVIAVIALLSMVLGNLAAIAQSSVKRLLAYSAIAHAGYALLGLLANNATGVSALMYYIVTYALTTVGAFGVVALVEARAGDDKLETFAGLSRRAPGLALCLMIFVLSLAGIPPLAGFFGKFYVFTAVLKGDPKQLGLLWLVIVAIAMSAVSLYYYLQLLKQVYINAAPAAAAPLETPLLARLAIGLLALAVLVLGCAPDLLLQKLAEAIRAAGW